MANQLALFGCGRCDGPLRAGGVSTHFCDACLRVFLIDSITGREHFVKHPATGYRVSSLGNVKSSTGAPVKGFPGGRGGYPTLEIRGKHRRIHRMVLEAFIGPCPPGMQACHYDECRHPESSYEPALGLAERQRCGCCPQSPDGTGHLVRRGWM